MSRKIVQKGATEFMNALAGRVCDDLRAEMETIAEQEYPKEACGFLIKPKRKRHLEVMRCENKSAEPESYFRITNYDQAERRGEVKAVWHSHPNRRPDPSQADMTMAESCELPMFLVGWPTRQWAYYKPHGWRAPLLGRPFVHGVLDCYTLVRDYYREKLDIELPDFEREDEWWIEKRDASGGIVKPAGNLYLDNFKKAGFVRVDDLQQHDCLLITRMAKVPNHAAVYIGDGMIMHHVANRLSELHPYLIDRGAYAKHTYGIYRHKSRL